MMHQEVPEGWKKVSFSECVDKNTKLKYGKVKKIDYLDHGDIPVIDQGQDYIAGFTNDKDMIFPGRLPVTIFGDHTLIVKYVEKEFAVGADGTVSLYPNSQMLTDKYFYYLVSDHKIKSEGYQRHFKYLKERIFIIPPLSEQRKIASILSTVDDAIEKTNTIIEETKQLKKGLMQKFFVNKAYMILRKANEEPTELKPIYLRELGKILTGTTPSTKVDEYYCSQDYMFIGPADLGNDKSPDTSEKYISSAGFNVARQLPSDSVMVVCIGATIGKVGITNKPCATNQQINTIIPSKAYSADYVYYLISGISKYLLAFAGDTATPILNKGEFGKVVTFVHNSLDERHQIAKILSAVDTKIENEMSTREQLEQLKKGLMQLLLTGKIRVKV